MDIDYMTHWVKMRKPATTERVVKAIFAKHGDKMPGWGEWPGLITEAHDAAGKKWSEPVIVPIPVEPGWKAVHPPKEKSSGPVVFGSGKVIVDDPNYALSISSISDDSDDLPVWNMVGEKYYEEAVDDEVVNDDWYTTCSKDEPSPNDKTTEEAVNSDQVYMSVIDNSTTYA